MKNNQNGFIGIALLVIVAIGVGIAGTLYYVKKDLPTQPDLTTETPISEPTQSSTSTEKYTPTQLPNSPTPPNNTKTYSSAKTDIEFSYPNNLYAHDGASNGTYQNIDITPDKTLIVQGMDGNVTNYDVLIVARVLSRDEASLTTKQHLALMQKERGTTMPDYYLDEFKKVGLDPKISTVTINGIDFIERPFYWELGGYVSIIYYTYKDGKEYAFHPRSYENKASLAALNQVITSLKFK